MSWIRSPRCAAVVVLSCLLAGSTHAQDCSQSPGDAALGGGTAGAPALELAGLAQVGLPFPQLRISGGPPGAEGVLLLGEPGAPTPLPGLDALLHVAPPFRAFSFQLDEHGRADVDVSALPALLAQQCGDVLVAQAGLVDAAAPGGWAVTDARSVRVGRRASGPFLPRQRHYVGATDAVVVDVHPDGILDIVSCDGVDTVTVLRGLADGTYAVEAMIQVPGGPSGIRAADLDGDGDTDLVTRNVDGGSVATLINQGDGAFQLTLIQLAFGFTRDVVVSDVDHDGVPDIVCVNASSLESALSFVRGLGDGSFAAPVATPFAFGFSARSLQAADVDGDGTTDLVLSMGCVSNPGVDCPDDEGFLRTLLGNGDGSFVLLGDVPVPGFPSGSTHAVELALGDLDGDRSLDVVAHVDTQSMNGSSRLDRYRNDGRGGFTFVASVQATQPSVGTTIGDIELVDEDGDGHLDVVVADRSSDTVNILRGLGDGSLTPWEILVDGVDRPTGVRLVDLDRDTLRDLVTLSDQSIAGSTPSDRVGITRAVPGGGYEPPPPKLDVGQSFARLASSDVDGDGLLDVVTCTGGSAVDPGRVELLLGAPGGTFVPAGQWFVGSQPIDLLLQDVSGDGLLDVVSLNRGSNDLSVLLGEPGGGGFTQVERTTAPAFAHTVVAGDLDGDGHTDLVVARDLITLGTPQLWFLRGSGGGGFDEPEAIPGSANLQPESITLADLDDDGDQDLAVASSSDADLVLFRNDGAGVLTLQALPTLEGQSPSHVVAADIDGDGVLDLLAASRADSMGSVSALITWRGLGGGTFAAPEGWGAGIDSRALALGDLDGDGFDDAILTLGFGVGEAPMISVLRGLPGGAFGPQVSYEFGDAGEFTVGRFDDDAALDVLIESDGRLRLLRNQLFD